MAKLSEAFSSIRFWVLATVGVIVLLLVYYVAADRYTPYTSDAYVQAFVIQIAPQINGPVTKVYVENGSQVEKGDPLYTIDPRPFRHEVDRLRALLVQAEAEIRQIESSLEAQKQIIEERKANVHLSQRTFDRIEKLAADSFAAQQRLDEATDDLRSNTALLSEAKAEQLRLEQRLDAMIDDDHAEVKQVKAKLANAELALGWTTVAAPVDGIVDNVQLRVGTYVNVGEAVLSFVDTTRWWIVANFQENALSVIRPDQRVGLSYFMYPGESFSGTVESIGWGVGQGQGLASGVLPVIENPTAWISLSQRFQVRIEPGQMPADRPLRVGASVRAVVYTQERGLMNGIADGLMWIAGKLDYIY
ncbi:MAG: HlyD family secretion protein [Pseudomonadota bacterium]